MFRALSEIALNCDRRFHENVKLLFHPPPGHMLHDKSMFYSELGNVCCCLVQKINVNNNIYLVNMAESIMDIDITWMQGYAIQGMPYQSLNYIELNQSSAKRTD